MSIAGTLLLAGCWTSSDSSTEPGAAVSSPVASESAVTDPPAPSGPVTACEPGDGASDAYECAGVTVTGARDAEPSLTFADDFGPASELIVADVYEGSGAEAGPGATVTTHYLGKGQASGEVFDSSWGRGEPLSFGLDQVIPGWRDGIPGMKVGGRRLLIIPGELAYGDSGVPGIGPNETLVFVVDLVGLPS